MSIAKLVVSEVRTANIDVENIDMTKNVRLLRHILGRTRMDICPLAFAMTVVEKLMYENGCTIDDIKVMKDVYPIAVKQFGKSLNTTAANIERLARRCWDNMIAKAPLYFIWGVLLLKDQQQNSCCVIWQCSHILDVHTFRKTI